MFLMSWFKSISYYCWWTQNKVLFSSGSFPKLLCYSSHLVRRVLDLSWQLYLNRAVQHDTVSYEDCVFYANGLYSVEPVKQHSVGTPFENVALCVLRCMYYHSTKLVTCICMCYIPGVQKDKFWPRIFLPCSCLLKLIRSYVQMCKRCITPPYNSLLQSP